MGRTAAREAPEEIELEATEIERQNDEISDTIAAELDASPDDVEWALRVYRVTGSPRNGAGEPYLFSLDHSELGSLRDKLRDEYGSGLYRVKVRKNKILYRQFDIPIEALPQAAIAEKQATSEIASVLQAMQEQSRESTRVMMELFNRLTSQPQASAQTDPFMMMERMVATMAGMKTLMPQAPENGAEKTMELVLKGIELGKSVSGEGGGGETNIMDLLREVIKNVPLGDIIGGMRNGNQTPNPPTISGGQSQPVLAGRQITEANNSINGAANSPPQSQNAFIGALNYLISRAAKGSPPELYAEWALDNLPPEIIKQMVSTPDALDQLQKAVPALVPYNPWFARLLETVKQIVQDEESHMDSPNADGQRSSPVTDDGHS